MMVEILPAAEEDLTVQHGYLVRHASEAVADRMVLQVEAAIMALALRPQIGAPCNIYRGDAKRMRSWKVKGFPSMRVYYVQRLDLIQVVRILHGKRDLESLLSDDALDEE